MFNRKNNNPNDRQGFLNYCRTIAGIEKDKDEFCKVSRIPRGGADIFANLDNVFLDLNHKLAKRDIYECEYLRVIDRIRAIIIEQNAHELRMAELEAGKAADTSD